MIGARKNRWISDIITYPFVVAAARWIAVLWLLVLPASAAAPHALRWALLAYAVIASTFSGSFWHNSRFVKRDAQHPLVLPALIAIDVTYAALAAKLYGVTILAIVPALDVAMLATPLALGLLAGIDVCILAVAIAYHFGPPLASGLEILGLTVGPYLAVSYAVCGRERAEHQIRAIDQVLNAGTELGSQLSLSDVLKQLLNLLGQFRRVVGWDTCVIYVVQYDETAEEEMLVAAEIAGDAEAYRGMKVAFGTGVVGYAATKQRAALIGDLQKDARQPDADLRPQARGCITVPIVSEGQTVGCVALIASQPNVYTADQLGLINRLISLASVGVRNAVLHGRTRAMADTDSLTGLLTSRAYHERLEVEFRKAQASRTSLSLLIIDVDNFKRVNDSYGHPAGDELLRRIGAMLRQQARRNDLCCRYGGDEFVVVMPETIKSEAAVVAGRIRKTIEAMAFAQGSSVVQATVSIGAASYPQDVITKQALFKAADDALYAAKRSGRNALQIFAPPIAR